MEYNLSTQWTVTILILAVWELVWKGVALWKAGRKGQPGWFIALLLVNSLGILPIIYLLTHRSVNSNTNEEYHHEKALPVQG